MKGSARTRNAALARGPLLCLSLMGCGVETPPQLVRARVETFLLPVAPTEIIATIGNEIVGASILSGCASGACAPVLVAIPLGQGVRLGLTVPLGRTLPIRFAKSGRADFDVCVPQPPFELGRVRAGCEGNLACESALATLAQCHAQQAPSCDSARADEALCIERASVRCTEANKAFEECIARGKVEDCDQQRLVQQMECSACDELHKRVVETCLVPCAPLEQSMLEVCAKPPLECPEERLFLEAEAVPPERFGACK